MAKQINTQLRQAFSSFMTGVTVVTARAPDNTPVGFTANSFTSVSLDPPLLLVCPGRHLSSFGVFDTTEHFAVNVLAHTQEAICTLFAGRNENRFSAVHWRPDDQQSPLIDGCSASFSCRTYQRVDAGDHLVLIGQITGFECSGTPDANALDGRASWDGVHDSP